MKTMLESKNYIHKAYVENKYEKGDISPVDGAVISRKPMKVMVRSLLYMMGIVLFLGLGSSNAEAQSIHNHAMCGVGLNEGQAIKDRMLDNRRRKAELLQQFESSRGNDSTVWVPVQFHIVNKSDGTGGESVNDILANLCRLNADYKHINVEFYLAGPIRVINQDLLYTNTIGDEMGTFFMTLYRRPGMVNIYIGNQVIGGIAGGTVAGYYTSGIDVIYAIKGSVHGNGTTLTHELGHFFSLPHTFFGWENSQYGPVVDNTTGRTPTVTPNGWPVENIIRSGGTENCQIAADAFCDTDANYYFGFFGNTYNNGGCTYAATAHDPTGRLFLPSVIAPHPLKFRMKGGEAFPDRMEITNTSTKDKLYPKTLVTVRSNYVLGLDTIMMAEETIGHSDETKIACPASSSNNVIGAGGNQTDYGIINFGGHYLDMNVSSPTAPTLSFISAQPRYEVISSSGMHNVVVDSIRVTNTSTSVTVPVSTDIVVTDIFFNGTTPLSSAARVYPLPVALAPGASYTLKYAFPTAELRAGAENLPKVAGVSFIMDTYAPIQTVSGTTSENVMSYYPDACATQFSVEQGDAMKADIASRGFATLYSAPSDIGFTDTVSVMNPIEGAVASTPLVNFQWNALPGATMYHIRIEEMSCVLQGVVIKLFDDFMTTSTNEWRVLDPGGASGKCYRWTVTPINATAFCDTTSTAFQSQAANFRVYDWAVGVDQVESGIKSTKIYPNPSGQNQDVILEIKSSVIEDAQISIYNSIGQVVMPSQTISLIEGDNVQQLNTSSLPAGLYVVNIETNGQTSSYKLVIKDN